MKRVNIAVFILYGILVGFGSARAADKEVAKGVRVDEEKRTVSVDCKIAPRKMEDPKFQGIIYPVEVIACWAYPKGQKAHETVVTIDGIKPSEVHKAIESLGIKPGKPTTQNKAEGPEVNIYLEIPGTGDKPKRV